MRITLNYIIILFLLLFFESCGNRVNNPLLDLQNRNTSGDIMNVIIDIGDGLLTSEDPITPVTDTFSVKLGSQPAGDITIGPIVSQNPAEVLVVQTSLTFTPVNWDTWQTVTVMGVDDAVVDGLQRVTVDLGTVQGTGYQQTSAGKVIVYNMDDEAPLVPGVTLKASTINYVSESGLSSSFEVSLNSIPASNVTIGFTISDPTEGSFTAPFSGSTGTLTFTAANWFLPQTVTVQGVDDSDADGNQAFTVITGTTVSLDPYYNGKFNPPDVAFINVDDDKPGVTVTPLSTTIVSESGSTATFQMFLNSKPLSDVTFNVSTNDNTEGTIITPFVGDSGVITFTPADWSTPQTITVKGVDDAITDGNQPFTIIIGASTSADSAYNGTFDPPDLMLVNTDNDVAGGVTVSAGSSMLVSEVGATSSFEIVLNSAPLSNVTINVTSSNPAEGTIVFPFVGDTGTITFTPLDWFTSQTITVQGVSDGVEDGNKAFTIDFGATTSLDPVYSGTFTPSSINFINADNDTAGVTVNAGSTMLVSESGTTSSFQVVLNSRPTADVTITVGSTNTAEGTVSPGTLTFTSGNWFSAQTVTVTGVDDDLEDGNQPFFVTLSAASSTDTVYNNNFGPRNLNFINVDNDKAGVTINAGSQMLVSESGTAGSFEVVLNSKPTADVTINVSSSNPSEGTIQSPALGFLTFTPGNWNTAQTVIVKGVDDEVQDGNQAFFVTVSAASSTDTAYNTKFGPRNVNFINVDNDKAGVTINAGTQMLVSESGTTSSFQVVLNSAPADNVTINVSSSNPAEGTILTPASGTLTFTPLDWNMAQTVTVKGMDDDVQDGNQAFFVTVSAASSTDTVYDTKFGPTNVNFLNVDDDKAGITVNVGNGLITREHPTTPGSDTFQVVLNTKPAPFTTVAVAINITLGDATEGKISTPFDGISGTISFDETNWNIAKTITVVGVDDTLADGMQSYTITLSPAVSGDPKYNGLDPMDVTVYNMDDESQGSVVIIQLDDPSTSESGTSSRFQVFLSAQPTANVVIGGIGTIRSTDTTEGNITSPFAGTGTLTFTPTNWNVPQVVTVTGQPDDGDAVDVNYTIDLGYITSGDPYWDGMYAGSISYTNYNDFNKAITAYIWTAPAAGVFTSISGTGTRISFDEAVTIDYVNYDEGCSLVPIGFHFHYLGKWYNEILVYTNGLASFDMNKMYTWSNPRLFTAVSYVSPTYSPGLVLAPWWDDFYFSTSVYNTSNGVVINSYVVYQTQGVKPNRVLTIEWYNAAVVADDEYYQFQLKLYEGTNAIEFVYGSFTSSNPDTTSASIGIKDNVGGANNTFIEGLTGNRTLPGNSGLKRTDFPASGTVIRFQ